jgi:hypothetical protein
MTIRSPQQWDLSANPTTNPNPTGLIATYSNPLDPSKLESIQNTYSTALGNPNAGPRMDDNNSFLYMVDFCYQKGKDANRFNDTTFSRNCGMCMTTGTLINGTAMTGSNPIGVVVYREDKEYSLSQGIDAAPSAHSATCAPLVKLAGISSNVTSLAINAEQYTETMAYLQSNRYTINSGIGAGSQTLSCTGTSNGHPYVIKTGGYRVGAWDTHIGSSIDYTRNNLLSNTDIPARCIEQTSCTITSQSQQWDMSALCGYPLPTPVTGLIVDTTKTTATSLTFKWGGGLYADTYDYNLVTVNLTPNIAVPASKSSLDSAARSVTYTDLTPATTYRFSLTIRNNAGSAPQVQVTSGFTNYEEAFTVSGSVIGQTSDNRIPVILKDPSQITTTGFRVNWEGGTNARTLRLFLRRTGSAHQEISLDTRSTSHLLTDLQPATEYTYMITSSYESETNGALSTADRSVTTAAPPAPPSSSPAPPAAAPPADASAYGVFSTYVNTYMDIPSAHIYFCNMPYLIGIINLVITNLDTSQEAILGPFFGYSPFPLKVFRPQEHIRRYGPNSLNEKFRGTSYVTFNHHTVGLTSFIITPNTRYRYYLTAKSRKLYSSAVTGEADDTSPMITTSEVEFTTGEHNTIFGDYWPHLFRYPASYTPPVYRGWSDTPTMASAIWKNMDSSLLGGSVVICWFHAKPESDSLESSFNLIQSYDIYASANPTSDSTRVNVMNNIRPEKRMPQWSALEGENKASRIYTITIPPNKRYISVSATIRGKGIFESPYLYIQTSVDYNQAKSEAIIPTAEQVTAQNLALTFQAQLFAKYDADIASEVGAVVTRAHWTQGANPQTGGLVNVYWTAATVKVGRPVNYILEARPTSEVTNDDPNQPKLEISSYDTNTYSGTGRVFAANFPYISVTTYIDTAGSMDIGPRYRKLKGPSFLISEDPQIAIDRAAAEARAATAAAATARQAEADARSARSMKTVYGVPRSLPGMQTLSLTGPSIVTKGDVVKYILGPDSFIQDYSRSTNAIVWVLGEVGDQSTIYSRAKGFRNPVIMDSSSWPLGSTSVSTVIGGSAEPKSISMEITVVAP